MKICYFDCFSGISGDMILGALLDAGADQAVLKKGIRALGLKDVSLDVNREKRNSISGTRVLVRAPKEKKHRRLDDVLKIINKASLPSSVKNHAQSIFKLLAEAEAKVHGIGIKQVHFHEIGALDTIVDIVGISLAIEMLKIKRVYASALPLGSGKIKMSHGVLPVPAPAVVELLKGMSVVKDTSCEELVTPTGAAILKHFCKSNGSMPPFCVEKAGYGVGTKKLEDRANLLRVLLGNIEDSQTDEIQIVETQIDDMSPEIFAKLFEQLFLIGVLDASWTPIHMKENRPGFHLMVMMKQKEAKKIVDFIFQEFSTLGLRVNTSTRYILPRKSLRMKTSMGVCAIKIAMLHGRVCNVKPELRDVVKISKQNKQSLKSVHCLIAREAEKKYLGKLYSI